MIYRVGYIEGGTYLSHITPPRELIACFDGTPSDGLGKIEAELLSERFSGEQRLETDNVYFDPVVLSVTERGRESLDSLLASYGEWIDIYCDGLKFFAFNVTNELDCFNEELSVCRYSSRSGKRIHVDKYHLTGENLTNSVIFKLKGIRCSPFFVTERFKRLVEETKLTGFEFTPVEHSENTTYKKDARD